MKIPFSFTSSAAEETFLLGKRFAALVSSGSVVGLCGPLGAGKTCFVKGVAAGLGVEETVASPTYTIVSEYEGRLCTGEVVPVFHIDAYRLTGSDDFSAIGGQEIIYGSGVALIEWYERIADCLPRDAFFVDINISGDEERVISVSRGKG